MSIKSDFGLIFWIHLVLIVFAYVSPFLVPWQWIILGVLALLVQQIVLRGCILTRVQFGKDPEMTFYYRYLTLLGFKVNKKRLKFLMAWVMPVIVFIGAVVWQVLLLNDPYWWSDPLI